MKERKCYKAIISSCVLVLCMVFVALFAVMPTKASDKTIKTEALSNYSESGLNELIRSQKTAGYLYAGLFKSGTSVENLTKANAVAAPQDGESYEVKFVPAGVLGINAQVSGALLEDESYSGSSIRVVTAVDSLTYKEVGFSVVRADTGNNLVAEGTITKYVYKELYAVDATDKSGGVISYTPQDIHTSANYFKTYTITGVPAEYYNTDLIVTPYWVTYDDEIVYGSESIKTVNLGRSWVYINTAAHTDGAEYGTYEHPFTGLADALDAIVLDKNGKIVIRTGAAIKPESTFAWEKHGKDFTITGESGQTETLDFSNIEKFKIGDSVTFENMTLSLPTSQLYADGHRFEIAESVASDNSGVIIFGGGNGNDVKGDTNVTLLSGSYEGVYGGGLNGDVSGDTHVTIRNANVFAETSGTNRVCGGGRKGNVSGNTYVTIGENFNKDFTKWAEHVTLSLICGGGYGDSNNIAVVEKNTYVVIEDGAKTNHVYGAGIGYSDVNGKSHVTCDGGYSMSIYGGGALNAENANTSVVMKDGQVEQIFGGNREGMTGSADVHILGGSVLRRVYGGCYNDYTITGWDSTVEVDGYVSVTFGPDTYASLAKTHSKDDVAYMASSRYDNTTNEIGVFVLNDYDVSENPNVSMVGHSTYFDSITPYHYLVQATEGGKVYSEGDGIRVVPDEDKVATVRVNSPEENVGAVHAYITSEGVCKLPTYDSAVDVQNVYVVFTDSAPSDVAVGNYEAAVNGVHYATLEEAISVANTLSKAAATDTPVVVSLLKNAEVEETLNIAESANIAIQNADGVTATVNRSVDLTSESLLNVVAGAKVTVNGITLDGRTSDEITAGATELTSLTKGSASLVTVSGEASFTGATIQYVHTSHEGAGIYISSNGKVTMTGGEISNNYVTNGSGGAVSVYLGTFTMETGSTIRNNTASASGGAFIVRGGSTLTINDGTISGNKALVTGSNGGGAIFQHRNTTVNINGGTISGNQSSNNGGAIFVLSNASDHSTLKMTGGTIEENTAINGGGICLSGQCEFNMSAGDIKNNTAKGTQTAMETVAGKGSGVYVATNSESYAFIMTGGTISEHGSETSEYNSVGSGVYVEAKSHFKLQGNGEIENNYTTANGAGVAVAGKLSMSGGTIQNNTTTSDGGGVYVLEGGTLVMNTTTSINGNAAANGGGVYVDGGTFTMKKGTISSNTATTYGAGVYLLDGTFAMNNGSIINHGDADNSIAGATEGAGVYAAGTSVVTMTTGSISNNYVSGSGAGVSVVDTAQFIMNGGTVSNNVAKTSGGGIVVRSQKTETIDEVETKVAAFIMNDGTISENKAMTSQTAAGGAIYQDVDTIVSINKGTISGNNTTAGCGGAIYMASGAELTVSNGHITGNTSKNQAGAIYGAGANKLYFTGEGKIQGNKNNGEKAVQAILLAQCKTSTQVNLNSSFTIGGEGYSDEIRFNNLSNRDASNPILIINGILEYKLTLGFHNADPVVYIQCDDEATASSNMSNIVQNSTTTVRELTVEEQHIKVNK